MHMPTASDMHGSLSVGPLCWSFAVRLFNSGIKPAVILLQRVVASFGRQISLAKALICAEIDLVKCTTFDAVRKLFCFSIKHEVG